jgi:hypothetical protein
MEDSACGLRLFRWCVLEVFVAFLDNRPEIGVQWAFEACGERGCDQA